MKPPEQLPLGNNSGAAQSHPKNETPKTNAEREKNRKWNAAKGVLVDAAAEFKKLYNEWIAGTGKPNTHQVERKMMLIRRARIITGLPKRLDHVFSDVQIDRGTREANLIEAVLQLAQLANAALASPVTKSLEVLLTYSDHPNDPNILEKLIQDF